MFVPRGAAHLGRLTRVKRTLGNLSRLLISLGVVAYLGWHFRGEWGRVREVLAGADLRLFFASCALFLLSLLTITFRLHAILRVQNVRISIPWLFYLGLVGQFFNVFLPSSVGGDVAKAYYAYRHSGRKIESFTSVLLDRILGFFAMNCYAVAALAWYGREMDHPGVRRAVWIMVALGAFAILFFMSKRVARRFKVFGIFVPSARLKARLKDVYHAIHQYRGHPLVLIWTLLVSFVAQAFFIVLNYLLGRSIGLDVPLGLYFFLIPIVAAIAMAPSISGLGVREAAFAYLFSFHVPSHEAVALALLHDAMVYGMSLSCGVLYAFVGGVRLTEIRGLSVGGGEAEGFGGRPAASGEKRSW